MIVKNNKYQREWHNATKPLKKKKKKNFVLFGRFWICCILGKQNWRNNSRNPLNADRTKSNNADFLNTLPQT
jgi:hypothetical protein